MVGSSIRVLEANKASTSPKKMSYCGSARFLSSCICRRPLVQRLFSSTAAISGAQDVPFSEIHKNALSLNSGERARLLNDLQELNAKEVMENYGGKRQLD